MNLHCQRRILRFVYLLPHKYTCECKCCSNFSVILFVPESMDRKDSLENEGSSITCNKNVSIDSFTENLLKKKIHKWESHAMKLRQEKYIPTHLAEQTCDLEENEKIPPTIGTQYHLETSNISTEVIRRFFIDCQKKNTVPATNVLSFLLHSCAQKGDKESIIFAKNIIKSLDPIEYQKQSGFDHYLAEAIWRSGNFEHSLTLFWNICKENTLHQNTIKILLKILIADAISSKGDAVLVLITQFSKKFADTFSDYSFLSHVWEHCFLSEWHSDNQVAANLLEEYPQLKNIIVLRVHHITSRALMSHKVEVVQRLFEVLLKYEMKIHYELVLRSLFDYACSVRDMYACSAIIQSSYDLDVTLTEEQNARFLELFCQQDRRQPIKLPIKTWHNKPTKFTFKF